MVGKERLKDLVDRIETTMGEIELYKGTLRDLYADAKALGVHVKALRKVIAERRGAGRDDELEYAADRYRLALGMTPLEELAARPQETTPLEAAIEEVSPHAEVAALAESVQRTGNSVTITGPDGEGVTIRPGADGRPRVEPAKDGDLRRKLAPRQTDAPARGRRRAKADAQAAAG